MDLRYAPPTAAVADRLPPETVVDREPFFYSSSSSKVVLLGGLTFGFYLIWWFWTQWRAEAPTEGRGSALWKTIFSGFFFYSMARQVKEEALNHGVRCGYSPALLTALVWIDAIAIRVLPQMGILIAVLLIGLPVLPVQATINRLSREIWRQPPRGWRWWEILLGGVLGLIFLLAIAGTLLPPAAGA